MNWHPATKHPKIDPQLTTSTLYVKVVRGKAGKGGGGRSDLDKNSADGNLYTRTAHGLLARQFGDGGFLPSIGSQQPRIEPNHGDAGIQWAETGAGPWEAFVSGHPAKRGRSRSITEVAADRLGGDVVWRNADGGIRDYRQLVTAPRTAAPPAAPMVVTGPSLTQYNTGVDAAELSARNAAQWNHTMRAWAVQNG
jgi:hypothetical protein